MQRARMREWEQERSLSEASDMWKVRKYDFAEFQGYLYMYQVYRWNHLQYILWSLWLFVCASFFVS